MVGACYLMCLTDFRSLNLSAAALMAAEDIIQLTQNPPQYILEVTTPPEMLGGPYDRDLNLKNLAEKHCPSALKTEDAMEVPQKARRARQYVIVRSVVTYSM